MVEGPQKGNQRENHNVKPLASEELEDFFVGPPPSSATRPSLTYNADTIDQARKLNQDQVNPFAEHIEVFSSSPQGQRSYSLESKTEVGGSILML